MHELRWKLIPFIENRRRALAAAMIPAGLLLALMATLQPMGLDHYQSPTKLLEILGFGLCIVLPAMLWHPVEAAIYRRQQRRWYPGNEVTSLVVLVASASLLGHFYNELTLNRWPRPDWSAAALAEFLRAIALPYSVFIGPAWAGARWWLARSKDNEPSEGLIRIRGDNESDFLVIRAGDFRYARAGHNYVELFYLHAGEIDSCLLRGTLSAMAEQIPPALKVHRSFLVHTGAIERIEGTSRKCTVHLHDVDQPIPVSARHYHRLRRSLR